MAKYTVLEMVQLILNSMDSDEVETFNETVESLQVSDVLRQTFEEMLDRRHWEFMQNQMRQLDTPSGGHIVQLDIPTDVTDIKEVRYKDFDASKFVKVRYLSPQEFLDRTVNRDSSLTEFTAVTVNDGAQIVVYNERVPQFYTSFDEETLVFDAVDTGTEANLTAANSMCLAEVRPTWTASDAFVPDIPEEMFSYLLHEAISSCWVYIKQEANPKAEAIARRQYIRLREQEKKVVKDREEVNYGR